ncbi:MAG TPA: hypothetical protein VGL58_20855 [Caulobacteraceae bacterium]
MFAGMLGVGVGAECRTDAPPRAAPLGPRIQMSEAVVLAPSPLVAQRPGAPTGG